MGGIRQFQVDVQTIYICMDTLGHYVLVVNERNWPYWPLESRKNSKLNYRMTERDSWVGLKTHQTEPTIYRAYVVIRQKLKTLKPQTNLNLNFAPFYREYTWHCQLPVFLLSNEATGI